MIEGLFIIDFMAVSPFFRKLAVRFAKAALYEPPFWQGRLDDIIAEAAELAGDTAC